MKNNNNKITIFLFFLAFSVQKEMMKMRREKNWIAKMCLAVPKKCLNENEEKRQQNDRTSLRPVIINSDSDTLYMNHTYLWLVENLSIHMCINIGTK